MAIDADIVGASRDGASIKRNYSSSRRSTGKIGSANGVADIASLKKAVAKQIGDYFVRDLGKQLMESENPVVQSAEWAYHATDLIKINEQGVKTAADYINRSLETDSYTPRTWRTHPLHICPPEPYSPADPLTKKCLDWIFLISSLNFSFWSEKQESDRYGVEWKDGWGSSTPKVSTGYWSLVAGINRALEENIPILDPTFYSSPERCDDSLIEYVFRPHDKSAEDMPLLEDRIRIMRENGSILCEKFGGSFQNFIQEFQRKHQNRGTTLQLVQMVTDTFPSFRDETLYKGHKVHFWKRPQILVAETWAAFYPPSPSDPHPLFPTAAAIHQLTMFADYRVPQILHHLRILAYPASLTAALCVGTMFEPGCREEVSIRAASILGVERVREEIRRMRKLEGEEEKDVVCSVVIDFYLWDLAKRIEGGEEHVGDIQTSAIVPAHRTRSIWY